MNSKERLRQVVRGEVPDRIPFAPNIWQWFEFQKLHKLLPGELAECETHLDAMRVLGVDVFSRNLITDIRKEWFGHHVTPRFKRVRIEEVEEGHHRAVKYRTPFGELSESHQFQQEGATLIQDEFLIKDFERDYKAWKFWVEDRDFEFDGESFGALQAKVGNDGIAIAGEITSPLKQLHLQARADNTTFFLCDHENEVLELMKIHTEKTCRLVSDMTKAGVEVVMSMDNLDSTFFPPPYFRRYCSDFFSRISEICHQAGAYLFSHACGQQRSILPLVVEAGVDGLEGVAFPPLGDVELWEAREVGENFIVTGGLSAIQLEGDVSQEEADRYVCRLFERMKPANRFIFSMSCNTSIRTSWDTLRRYRDAWLKFGKL